LYSKLKYLQAVNLAKYSILNCNKNKRGIRKAIRCLKKQAIPIPKWLTGAKGGIAFSLSNPSFFDTVFLSWVIF